VDLSFRQAEVRASIASVQTILDAVGSPRRREILRLVWDSELTAGEIASRSDVSWPAVSQNLKVLRSAGLINERREGTRRYYKTDQAALGPMQAVLRQMWQDELGAVDAAMERERRG
jgi:DNA-binding transcriptional ArsR family regulator